MKADRVLPYTAVDEHGGVTYWFCGTVTRDGEILGVTSHRHFGREMSPPHQHRPRLYESRGEAQAALDARS